MTKNPRQTLKILTIKLVDLAIQHNLVISTELVRNTFKNSNQKRRVYDAINVLKAINLIKKEKDNLIFDPILVNSVYPPTQPIDINYWNGDSCTWMHDPLNDCIYDFNEYNFT